MAEIRSTMDIVMERAARIGRATSEELKAEEAREAGMRLAAEVLEGRGGGSPLARLAEQPPDMQAGVRQGMVDALLRNVALARDDYQRDRVRAALQALLDLGGGAGDLRAIVRDIENIVDQYGGHREQVRQQLEASVRMQLQQALARQAGMNGLDPSSLDLDLESQPEFQQEWARVENELSSQYTQALEQHKQLLRSRLA